MRHLLVHLGSNYDTSREITPTRLCKSCIVLTAWVRNGGGRPQVSQLILNSYALIIGAVAISNALVMCSDALLQIITLLWLFAHIITLPKLEVFRLLAHLNWRLEKASASVKCPSSHHAAHWAHWSHRVGRGVHSSWVDRGRVHTTPFTFRDAHLARVNLLKLQEGVVFLQFFRLLVRLLKKQGSSLHQAISCLPSFLELVNGPAPYFLVLLKSLDNWRLFTVGHQRAWLSASEVSITYCHI